MQVHEANRTPNDINSKTISPRHIILKLSKVNEKEKLLRAARDKKIADKVTPSGFKWISQQKPCNLGESGVIYSKYGKTKTVSQEYSIQLLFLWRVILLDRIFLADSFCLSIF